MENNLRLIAGIVVLIAGAIVWVVYLYESGKFGPRLSKYLRLIPALAIISVALYALYHRGTMRLLYLLDLFLISMAIAYILERVINRYRKLTRFGSRMLVLIVIVSVSIWSNLYTVYECIANGIGFFIASVWYYASDDDKEQLKS
jgi:hypothetical protein